MRRILQALRREGVLGINQRNSRYTLRWNPRRLYPLVDDKLKTKELCQAAGIPTPRLLAVAREHFELRGLRARLDGEERFVLKPSRGAMGNGILIVRGRRGDGFIRSGGKSLTTEDLLYHAAGIISGMYALGGQPDSAMVEEFLEVHPTLVEITQDGVPDVRVIVYRGIPIMAMVRLPTLASGGRANLHQGAVGVGVDIVSGLTTHAVCYNRPIRRHPDSRVPLLGRTFPDFERVVRIALRAADQVGLGYVGADVVVDARYGPVILELNARPGLAVQLANRAGLRPRLTAVDDTWQPDRPFEERITLAREIASSGKLA